MSRDKRTPRNVFVLSGGGARGAAQIGMVRALLQAGVTPHAFVGTSVGALNAAFLGCGPTLDRVAELEQHWLTLSGSDIFAGSKLSIVRHLLSRHPYVYGSDGIKNLICSWVPHTRLEELSTPVRVVTTDLGTGKPVYHDTGRLDEVLLASASLPGVFPPVLLPDPVDGTPAYHVDGGVADLVPISGALDLHPTRVYVLDVTVPPIFERARNPLEVVVASLGVAMRLRPVVDFGHNVTITHLHATDIHISTTDFTRTADLVELGHRTTLDALAHSPAPAPARRGHALGRLVGRGASRPAPAPAR